MNLLMPDDGMLWLEIRWDPKIKRVLTILGPWLNTAADRLSLQYLCDIMIQNWHEYGVQQPPHGIFDFIMTDPNWRNRLQGFRASCPTHPYIMVFEMSRSIERNAPVVKAINSLRTEIPSCTAQVEAIKLHIVRALDVRADYPFDALDSAETKVNDAELYEPEEGVDSRPEKYIRCLKPSRTGACEEKVTEGSTTDEDAESDVEGEDTLDDSKSSDTPMGDIRLTKDDNDAQEESSEHSRSQERHVPLLLSAGPNIPWPADPASYQSRWIVTNTCCFRKQEDAIAHADMLLQDGIKAWTDVVYESREPPDGLVSMI